MTFLTLYKKINLKFIKTVLAFSKNEVLSFFYSFPLNNSPIKLIVLKSANIWTNASQKSFLRLLWSPVTSFLLLIQLLVEDSSRRISTLNMAQPCAFLSIENCNVKCFICTRKKIRNFSSKGWENFITISKQLTSVKISINDECNNLALVYIQVKKRRNFFSVNGSLRARCVVSQWYFQILLIVIYKYCAQLVI